MTPQPPVPQLVLSIDTTGVPKGVPGWEPRVVGIAAALVGVDGTVQVAGCYVRQPETHVLHPAAADAFDESGIDPHATLEHGAAPDEVATWLRTFVDNYPVLVFARDFAEPILCAPPWWVQRWGPCIQETAARAMDVPLQGDGVTPKGPRRTAALAWVEEHYSGLLDGVLADGLGATHENPASKMLTKALRDSALVLALRRGGWLRC